MYDILKFDNIKIIINIILIFILIYEFYRMYIRDSKDTKKSRNFIKKQLNDPWGLGIIGIMIFLLIIIHIYHNFYPDSLSIDKYKRGITIGFFAWLVSCFSAMGYTITLFYLVVFFFIFFNFKLI